MPELRGWTGDLLGLLTHWREFCDAVASGRAPSARRREFGEHLALFPVWQPESYVLAFVDPDDEHVSLLGEGTLPKLLELQRLAAHAYREGLGDTLFPPLSVRMGGKETRFRWAGYGDVLAFAGPGTGPPTQAGPVVVLAPLRSGYNLVGILGDRALLIAQGRLRVLEGLDLDRLLVWARLREQVEPCARIERVGGGSGEATRVRRLDEREHFGAALHVALLALVDELPNGARGRREAVSFMGDLARLAALGVPDIYGSSKQVAEQMGRALGQAPRDSRTIYAVLSLLHQHGLRHDEAVIVSKRSGQRWAVHVEDLASPDSSLCEALLSRRPVLRGIVAGDDAPATPEEIRRARILPSKGGAVRLSDEAPILLGAALSSESDLRQQREAELWEARETHAQELRGLRSVVDSLTEKLGDATARNAVLAAELAKSDARIEHLQRHASELLQRLSAVADNGWPFGGNPVSSEVEESKQTVKSFIAAFVRRDPSALETLVAPTFVGHGYALGRYRVRTREDLLRSLAPGAEAAPTVDARLDCVIAEGGRVSAIITWTGGQSEIVQIHIYRVEAGQLVEAWGAEAQRADEA